MELLLRVESECKKVGIHLNTKKTKVMVLTTIFLKTADGQTLQVEKDFKRLGSLSTHQKRTLK